MAEAPYLLENGHLLRTATLPGATAAGGLGRMFGGMGGMAFGAGQPMGGNPQQPADGQPQPANAGGGAGGRVQECTWDGEVVWEYRFASPTHIAHHDIQRLPNGNVLILAWEAKTAREAIAAGRSPAPGWQRRKPCRAHFIIEVKPTGPKVRRDRLAVAPLGRPGPRLRIPSKANHGDVAAHPLLNPRQLLFAGMDAAHAGGTWVGRGVMWLSAGAMGGR